MRQTALQLPRIHTTCFDSGTRRRRFQTFQLCLRYPFNPNGSPEGIVGLCSCSDGDGTGAISSVRGEGFLGGVGQEQCWWV